MKLQGFISVAALIAIGAATVACDGSSAPTEPSVPGPRLAKPDNPGGGGGGGGKNKGTVTVRFDGTGGVISASVLAQEVESDPERGSGVAVIVLGPKQGGERVAAVKPARGGAGEVDEDEQPPSILARHVREAPDVAQADR